jgi:hypothetical protein
MADFTPVTMIPTPDTHPECERVQPFRTWINLAMVYQLLPATDADLIRGPGPTSSKCMAAASMCRKPSRRSFSRLRTHDDHSL